MSVRRRAGVARGRSDPAMPVQANCEVIARRQDGPYWLLSLAAPEIARRARAGQFVNVAVEAPGTMLRRPFSIAGITRQGAAAGTIDIVFDAHGPGTRWLTTAGLHDVIDVIGPLGNGFPLPQRRVGCLLVGGGYGVAPLIPLARDLTDRQLRVDMLVGAASAERLHSPVEARSASVSATFTTEDGSYGVQGRVTDVLAEILTDTGAGVVYACGPNAMLRAVSDVCADVGVPVQVAVEEHMACGVGVCFTCVMPVRGRDGTSRMRRTCLEGPVLNGARVAWDETRWAAPVEVGEMGDPAEPVGDGLLDAGEVT
ncbi:MAG: dihydroorotate dehydrogenase electron transfer subunit [Nitriliruptoraceae bacterium]